MLSQHFNPQQILFTIFTQLNIRQYIILKSMTSKFKELVDQTCWKL